MVQKFIESDEPWNDSTPHASAIHWYGESIFTLSTGQSIDIRLILGYSKHLLTLPQQFV